MQPWVTSSEMSPPLESNASGRGIERRSMTVARMFATAWILAALSLSQAAAQAPETERVPEVPAPVRVALEQAFSEVDGLRIEAEVFFLSDEEVASLSQRLERQVEPVIVRYVVRANETVLGVGYVDTHRVRTLSESILIVIDASGALKTIGVLAFGEPKEYLPHERWYAQFDGLSLDAPIKYGREIDAVTGATLTGRSTVDAVARVAMLHEALLHEPYRQQAGESGDR